MYSTGEIINLSLIMTAPPNSCQNPIVLDVMVITALFFCQKSWEHTDNQKGNVFFLVEEEAGGDAMLVSAYQNVCLNKINRVPLQAREKCHRRTNDIASFNPGNYCQTFLWKWLELGAYCAWN